MFSPAAVGSETPPLLARSPASTSSDSNILMESGQRVSAEDTQGLLWERKEAV